MRVGAGQFIVFCKMVRIDLIEKVKSEQRLEVRGLVN